ncbi:MAG TPA: tetratricopeptide repeat protein [bacterium]|nr:tetratricopeptide repeat protein [bacterium]
MTIRTISLSLFLLAVLSFLPGRLCAQNDHYPEYMEMGNKALATEKYDLAVDYFSSAIDDKEDCWQAYVGLGNCYYYQKKYKEALKSYERALKYHPDNPELARFVQNLRIKLGIFPTPTPVPTPTPWPLNAPLPGLPPLPPP